MSRVKFGDVVKDCKEKIDRNNNSYEFYVAGDHMDTEDLVIRRKGRFATDDVGPAFIRLFRLGQVLYGSRRTYLKKVAVADFEGVTANTTFVFETKDESVLRQRLLPFIMLSDSFTEWSIKRSKGSTNPYVLFSDLADFEFELPDVKQQDKYVELLWSIWNVKEAYRKLLAATDELVKARFVEMFGDPIENPMNWETSQLENIAEIRIGPFGSLLHKDDYIQGGHPIVNPSHIIDGTIVIDPNLTLTDSKYEELSCYSLQVGDVVLGRRGEMGRCAVVPSGGYLCGTGSIIIRPKNGIKSCLLQRIISSSTFCKYIESMAVGVTMKNLNVSIVSSFQIPLLPMELQEQYIRFLEQIEQTKNKIRDSLTQAEILLNSLKHRYFD